MLEWLVDRFNNVRIYKETVLVCTLYAWAKRVTCVINLLINHCLTKVRIISVMGLCFSNLRSAMHFCLFSWRASFPVNNGHLHWEEVQVLPIKWQRYIISLIKESYYEPAGAQCHKRGWKTAQLNFSSSGLDKQCSSPLSLHHFSTPQVVVSHSWCHILMCSSATDQCKYIHGC